jgi:hypothetical protein
MRHPALHVRHDALQASLPFEEWELAEIAAIEFGEIERTVEGPLAAEQELMEVAPSVVIETTHLAIENRRVAPHGVGEFNFEVGEVLERGASARDESAVMSLNVRQRPKPIELQLVEPIRMVEGVRVADEGMEVRGTFRASHAGSPTANRSVDKACRPWPTPTLQTDRVS